jgi:cold shock CspA family protein
MTTNNDSTTGEDKNSSRMIGQVKWFNNKAGYGFITVSDGEYAGKDIFAHYSTIRVVNTQYRYLVQGEYVEFNLAISTNTAHEYQATLISGIKGGLLMCETRQSNRPPRKEREVTNANATTDDNTTRRKPVSKRQMVEKPLSPVDIDGFKVVAKKRSAF